MLICLSKTFLINYLVISLMDTVLLGAKHYGIKNIFGHWVFLRKGINCNTGCFKTKYRYIRHQDYLTLVGKGL